MGAPTKAGVPTQGPLRALAKARLMAYDLKTGLADRGFGDPFADAERAHMDATGERRRGLARDARRGARRWRQAGGRRAGCRGR